MAKSIRKIMADSASPYAKLLDDPRWKEYGTAIRREARNGCQCCKRSDLITHIHHLFYDGRKPWEYERQDVALLCEGCHTKLHQELQNFRRFVFGKLTPRAMQIINGSLSVGLSMCDPLIIADAIKRAVIAVASKESDTSNLYNATEREYDEHKGKRVEDTYRHT